MYAIEINRGDGKGWVRSSPQTWFKKVWCQKEVDNWKVQFPDYKFRIVKVGK